MKKTFNTQEIEQLVKDHIQSKIDHNEYGILLCIGRDAEANKIWW